MQRLGCFGVAFGIIFALAGIVIIGGSILAPNVVRFSSEGGAVTPPWLGALFGLCFLVSGLFVLAMSRQHDPGDDVRAYWAAAVAVTFGIAITAAAFGDPDDSSFPMGRWPGTLGGMIFLVAGLATAAWRSPRRRIRETAAYLVVVLFTLFGALVTIIAIDSSQANGVISILGFSIAAPAWMDRIVVGFFALVLDVIALVGWYQIIRQPSRRTFVP